MKYLELFEFFGSKKKIQYYKTLSIDTGKVKGSLANAYEIIQKRKLQIEIWESVDNKTILVLATPTIGDYKPNQKVDIYESSFGTKIGTYSYQTYLPSVDEFKEWYENQSTAQGYKFNLKVLEFGVQD